MIFNTASMMTNLSLLVNSQKRLFSCSVIGLLIGFLVLYLIKISFVIPEACAIILNTASLVNKFICIIYNFFLYYNIRSTPYKRAPCNRRFPLILAASYCVVRRPLPPVGCTALRPLSRFVQRPVYLARSGSTPHSGSRSLQSGVRAPRVRLYGETTVLKYFQNQQGRSGIPFF